MDRINEQIKAGRSDADILADENMSTPAAGDIVRFLREHPGFALPADADAGGAPPARPGRGRPDRRRGRTGH